MNLVHRYLIGMLHNISDLAQIYTTHYSGLGRQVSSPEKLRIVFLMWSRLLLYFQYQVISAVPVLYAILDLILKTIFRLICVILA